jgi:polyferredoxin
MPTGTARDKILSGLAKKRGRAHRYVHWRWSVAVLFTLAVAALPAFGLLRIDLWGGRHQYLGRELGLVETLKHFAFPFLAINVAIIVASRFFGRYLCGFVCPYGAVARFADWLRLRAKSRARRFGASAALLGVCAAMCAVAFSFWVDWRVFAAGSSLAVAIAALFLATLIGSFYFMATKLGLGFCRDWCPSGVYFALLGHESFNGVEFAHPATCIECNACDKACPMDLAPREMSGGAYLDGHGFYPDGQSNFSLCIRCGDCVVACEGTTAHIDGPTPLRMGFLPPGARDANPPPELEPSAAEFGREPHPARAERN